MAWSCMVFQLLGIALACFHEGPDPIAHWELSQPNIHGTVLKARLGIDGQFQSSPVVIQDTSGQSVAFDGKFSELVIGRNLSDARAVLPVRAMTVSTWVMIDQGTQLGSVVGAVQQDGDFGKGWSLGYDQSHFHFAISTQGADDGNGLLTFIKSKTAHEPGKFFHLVGVYDGVTAQLFVNGKLEAESKLQSGDILYSPFSPLSIGGFHDTNEFHALKGRVREVTIYDIAAKESWVAGEFNRQEALTQPAAAAPPAEASILVEPFLQFGTTNSMTVVWRTSVASRGVLYWGEDITCANRLDSAAEDQFHTVRIEGLKPETQYFYRAESTVGDQVLRSEPSTFQTASHPGTPITFAIVSDTQYQPAVCSKIADMAWARRPNFVLHCGDIVDDGTKEYQWTNEFFAAMNPLLRRVPMFPAIGNHEKNAKDYYNYMALPDPEYYYTFSYGDADFFMIDSNKKVDQESEQYQWLDQALSKSTAIWKFVCHHHPPYSSDENDYGDLWKINRSAHGDLRIRALVPLYEKHHVDFVWSGHIHSYERTWPIRENKAVESGGTIYMITGGAGGSLESPGPYRPFFQNNVRRGHHYTMVHLHGRTLELKAFSLEDQLFDLVRIEKQR